MGAICCKEASGTSSEKIEDVKAVKATEAEVDDGVKLTVKVLGARGLRNADWSWFPGQGVSDAYCVVSAGGAELTKTNTVMNTLEPLWDHEAGCPEYPDDADLTFTVWDKDPIKPDDKLGAVVLKADQFKDGFSGELELQDSGKDGAYIAVMIRKRGKPYPQGPPKSFTITIEKEAGTFGVEVDKSEPELLYVCNVQDGPVKDYNDKVELAAQLKPGQYITEVNEVKGDATKMLEMCNDATKLVITVRRPVLWTISVNKPKGVALGMDLQIALTSLYITRVNKGPVLEWNTAHEAKTVVGKTDRVIAVGGKRGNGPQLLNAIKPDGPKQLLMSRMSPEESLPQHFFSWLRGDL